MKFKGVSKHIGIVVDTHYPRKLWVHELIQAVPKKGVVVTSTGGAHTFLEGTVAQRGDLYFELFLEDDWHGKKMSADIRDWLMISYLEFTKGTLYIFPGSYERGYGRNFSDRVQDLIITAHQKGVKYKVITGEE